MNRTLRLLMLTVGVPAVLLGLAAPATADPSRAPRLLRGSAKCGPFGNFDLFDFVVNQSNSDSQTWSPAFLTRSDGARGLFIPSSVDLIFFTPEGNFSFTAHKGATSGPVSCAILAEPDPEVLVVGTVTGKIILTSSRSHAAHRPGH